MVVEAERLSSIGAEHQVCRGRRHQRGLGALGRRCCRTSRRLDGRREVLECFQCGLLRRIGLGCQRVSLLGRALERPRAEHPDEDEQQGGQHELGPGAAMGKKPLEGKQACGHLGIVKTGWSCRYGPVGTRRRRPDRDVLAASGRWGVVERPQRERVGAWKDLWRGPGRLSSERERFLASSREEDKSLGRRQGPASGEAARVSVPLARPSYGISAWLGSVNCERCSRGWTIYAVSSWKSPQIKEHGALSRENAVVLLLSISQDFTAQLGWPASLAAGTDTRTLQQTRQTAFFFGFLHKGSTRVRVTSGHVHDGALPLENPLGTT
ncbi:hypothetical protein BD289DRAFT_118403 [Coniella lustricola]|uniref:Uncharacterized protein n=1 Tax=Coniella lustricola TaxID=2025994 RepID=A0A2T3AG18_9PEZI|nr:hypothetical protein BD289DRAFT_118403 [Coniella lustricola]